MTYINVGASKITGERIRTKKALKEYFATAPGSIVFDVTSPLGPMGGQIIYGNELPKGYKLQVVGPDPYTKRVWYATVTDTGKVT